MIVWVYITYVTTISRGLFFNIDSIYDSNLGDNCQTITVTIYYIYKTFVRRYTEKMEGEHFKASGSVDSLPAESFQQTPDGKWYCDVCSCVQENKDDLLTHRILHLSNERSKECPLCKKTFSSATTLRNHLTVHTGIKKYR